MRVLWFFNLNFLKNRRIYLDENLFDPYELRGRKLGTFKS